MSKPWLIKNGSYGMHNSKNTLFTYSLKPKYWELNQAKVDYGNPIFDDYVSF